MLHMSTISNDSAQSANQTIIVSGIFKAKNKLKISVAGGSTISDEVFYTL